jgi:hypothetical protein
MSSIPRTLWAGAITLALLGPSHLTAAQEEGRDEDRRPKFSVRARPNAAISPARIVLTAELTEGANDYQEYYCPTLLWEWGDGTESESTLDCEPYEAGKSEIRRRYTQEHTFRQAGSHRVWVRLKRNDKLLASANVIVHIQPGNRADEDR